MILYHDIPSSKGVENALKRAKQMVRVSYTPICGLPICHSTTEKDGTKGYAYSHAPAFFPEHGVLYSSVRCVERYVGYNISLETYITAMSNPNSVIYTREIEGTGQNVLCYYGIVCSCFASYVHDLYYRTPNVRWTKLPGVSEVDASELENLRLCDLVQVQSPKLTHIAVITDIERDVDGKVHYITVSESVLPYCRETRFTPEEFRGYWLDNGYRIYRNANVDRVTYTPNAFVPLEDDLPMPAPEINRSLMPDFGNKANYILGEEPVELSVFDESYGTVAVTGPDGSEALYPIVDGKVIVKPEAVGFYSACCIANGERSASVEWCVVGLSAVLDKTVYAFGEEVKLHFSNPAGDRIIAYQFTNCAGDRGCGSDYLDVTATEGELTLAAPTKSGKQYLFIIAQNRFGDYTTTRIDLEVLAKE